MSAAYPIVGPAGAIRLSAVVDTDDEIHLIIGRPDEPGAAELVLAVTKLADLATCWGASAPVRRKARREFDAAVEALWLAGRTAA